MFLCACRCDHAHSLSFDIHEAIIKAARIVLSNLNEGRVPVEEGVLVCIMGVYVDATGVVVC
jgi:hypothetical protein